MSTSQAPIDALPDQAALMQSIANSMAIEGYTVSPATLAQILEVFSIEVQNGGFDKRVAEAIEFCKRHK